MAIYAISDLHLSFSTDKPMNIFGTIWENYEEKIKENWINKITDDDLVLLPGDFSWAMYLKDTVKDFEYLSKLPGKKLLLKGNHDYWWTTLTSMRNFLKDNKFENIDFIYNNSYEYEGNIIVGTRGWILSDNSEDKRLVKRELLRLELSIQDGIKKYGNEKPIIVCMHYPPVLKNSNYGRTEFTEVMKKYNVKKCIYGHLHGTSQTDVVEGIIEGIDYKMVSCDYTKFELIRII